MDLVIYDKEVDIGQKVDGIIGIKVRRFVNVIVLDIRKLIVEICFVEFMIKLEWLFLRCIVKKFDFFLKKSVRSKVKIVERF